MPKLIIYYSDIGTPVNEFKVEAYVNRLLKKRDKVNMDLRQWVSSELVIYEIRLRIAKGLLSPDEVEIYFKHHISGATTRLLLDNMGRGDYSGFRSPHEKLLLALLDW